MFEGIAGHWIPIERSERLRGAPRRLEIASEHIVLTRDQGGRVRVGVEHRGPLELPALEAAGLVFVFTDPSGHAPTPSLPRTEPDRQRHVETWSIPWDRALTELLIAPHRPVALRGAASRAIQRWLRPGSIVDPSVASTMTGACVRWAVRTEIGAAQVEWTRPNGVVLRLGIGSPTEHTLRLWSVPIDRERCRVLVEHGPIADETPSLDEESTAPTAELVSRFRRWNERYGAPSVARPPFSFAG